MAADSVGKVTNIPESTKMPIGLIRGQLGDQEKRSQIPVRNFDGVQQFEGEIHQNGLQLKAELSKLGYSVRD